VADRGVVYIVWGEKIQPILQRSIASVNRLHPELPIHVETIAPDSTLLDKARMHRLTPFEETVFLDSDTVVLGRLDYGFDMAGRPRPADQGLQAGAVGDLNRFLISPPDQVGYHHLHHLVPQGAHLGLGHPQRVGGAGLRHGIRVPSWPIEIR